MQKIIDHFIKYPIAGWILIIAFAYLGYRGLGHLKSSFFPLVESREIAIYVTYPGASPQEMEEGIVLKIEDNIRGLVGIDRFTSISSENLASIYIEALKGYEIDAVLADVKNAVDQISSFPTGMEPPVVAKGIFITEAVTLALNGKGIPLTSLKKFATDVETDLKNIEGISQVDISGYPDEEIEIAISEDKLRTYDLTFDEVSDAVSGSNIIVTGGNIKTAEEEYLIRVRNRSYYAEGLEFIVIKTSENGDMVRLNDIAEVRDKWSETPDRSYFNGAPSIRLQVNATISEDLIDVAEKTNAYVATFNERHDNDNVNIDITRDSSIRIVQRSELLIENGIVGMALVMFFLAIFLKPRLAFWVAFGLPVSFLGMFMLAGSFGVTINVLSLFGMIIVIGILVDDGIVIAENIYYHFEKGKSPIQAAIDGTKEVLPAITSAILTTLVAFSTFFFLEGRIGEFFGEVSTVVILTLTISLIEALIILPSHISHSKALSPKQKTYQFNAWADRMMSWFRDKLYAPVLGFFLHHKFLGFAIPVVLLMLTSASFNSGIIRFNRFPRIASDRVSIVLEMPQGTHESITDSIITHIENVAWEVGKEFNEKYNSEFDAIENIVKRVGPGTSTASLNLNLVPGEDRAFPSYEIATAINNRVGAIHSAESVVYGDGGNFSGKPISVSLLGNDIEELKAATEYLKVRLQENPAMKDIEDNDPLGIKEIKISLKENAHLMGFTLSDVISQVRSGFFGKEIQRFQRRRDEIKVWVRFDRDTRSSIKNLDDMRIVNDNGNRIPLTEIATYEIARGEININHLNGKREIRVDGNLKDPKASAPTIMAQIQEEVIPEIIAKYPNITAVFEGQNRDFLKTINSAKAVLPVIIFAIFIIIAFTFRSFSQPLLLLLMIPFSLIGVAWGHWIHDFSINALSFLGIIALIGIVVNDGLVLIGKMNSNLKEGMEYNAALLEAGKSRFRAIFLTSITTVAGLAPLIFETSRQAQFLIPMAISVSYGIMIATLLTLVMLPLMLSTGNLIKVHVLWLWTGIKPSQEEVERAVKELNIENNHE